MLLKSDEQNASSPVVGSSLYHAADCVKHVNKYASFMDKNRSMPYCLKKKSNGCSISIRHVIQQ